MNWKRWNWLDLSMLFLGAVTRAVWPTVAVNALLGSGVVQPADIHLPLSLTLGLLLLGSLATRITARPWAARVLAALAGLVTVVAASLVVLPTSGADLAAHLSDLYTSATRAVDVSTALPAAWVVPGYTLLVWVWAVTVDWSDVESGQRGFLVGGVALGLLTVTGLYRQAGANLPTGNMIGAILLYVGAFMASTALAGVARTAAQSARARGSSGVGGGTGSWYVTAFLLTLVVALAGWLTLALGGADPFATALLRLLGWLWQVIVAVFVALATGVMFLLSPLLEALLAWVDRQTTAEEYSERARQFLEYLEEGQQAVPQSSGNGAPPWVGIALQVGLVLAVVVVIALVMRRRFHFQGQGYEEFREIEFSWEGLRAQVGQWLGRARERAVDLLPLEGNDDPRLAVRRAYRRVLEAAAARGLGHRPGQTPLAYMRSLSEQDPRLAGPLTPLTDAYNRARYSHEVPTPEQVHTARASAERVEGELRSVSGTGRAIPGLSSGTGSPGTPRHPSL